MELMRRVEEGERKLKDIEDTKLPEELEKVVERIHKDMEADRAQCKLNGAYLRAVEGGGMELMWRTEDSEHKLQDVDTSKLSEVGLSTTGPLVHEVSLGTESIEARISGEGVELEGCPSSGTVGLQLGDMDKLSSPNRSNSQEQYFADDIVGRIKAATEELHAELRAGVTARQVAENVRVRASSVEGYPGRDVMRTLDSSIYGTPLTHHRSSLSVVSGNPRFSDDTGFGGRYAPRSPYSGELASFQNSSTRQGRADSSPLPHHWLTCCERVNRAMEPLHWTSRRPSTSCSVRTSSRGGTCRQSWPRCSSNPGYRTSCVR